MEELLKIHYKDLNEKDLNEFKKLNLEKDPIDLKTTFHPFAFLFGWYYLIYRKLYLEGIAVVIISMLLFRLSPIIGLLTNNILSGLFYYFFYGQKFKRDLEKCGYPLTDKTKLKELGGVSIKSLITSIAITIILFWPVVVSYIVYIKGINP